MFRKTHSRLINAGQYRFSICGNTISYVLKRSTGARYLRLEIKPGIGLIVVAPKHCSLAFIENFIYKKQSWISKNLKKCQDKVAQKIGSEITNGSLIDYLGKKLILELHEKEGHPDIVCMENNKLIVNLDGSHKKLRNIVEGWYRFNAEVLIREKLAYWSQITGIKYHNYKIRGQRTRWGSCSRKGNLSLNWKLLMVPEAIIDYIIIHELAHLKEMNHSRSFWALVAHYCPQYKIQRKLLQERENLLAY